MDRAREKAQIVYRLLHSRFGPGRWTPLPAVDELISTILSQNTNDANRDKAFRALKMRYPDWNSLLADTPARVLEAIRPAGLGPQKAPRIRAVLEKIRTERGAFDLDFLRRKTPSEARAWLTSLPGVGPKTASIVMLFSLGIPAFPVDTHVHRVSGRLGLRPDRMSADHAHDFLAALFTPSQYASAHLNLIRLGREICRARNPQCAICPLRKPCPFPTSPSRKAKPS